MGIILHLSADVDILLVLQNKYMTLDRMKQHMS